VRPEQRFRQPLRGGRFGSDQRRRGGEVDVLAGNQAKEPERLGGQIRKLPVGPRQHGSQVKIGVTTVESVEPGPFAAEFADQPAQREVWLVGGTSGHDRQRQRQARAKLGRFGGGVAFGVYPRFARRDPGGGTRRC
jgi:hypothetical protein